VSQQAPGQRNATLKCLKPEVSLQCSRLGTSKGACTPSAAAPVKGQSQTNEEIWNRRIKTQNDSPWLGERPLSPMTFRLVSFLSEIQSVQKIQPSRKSRFLIETREPRGGKKPKRLSRGASSTLPLCGS
jgi:hypothetical protein